MIFYDEQVTSYKLRFSVAGGAAFQEEIWLDTDPTTVPYVVACNQIGHAVLNYLNTKTLLGVKFQETGHTDEQLTRFKSYFLTTGEEETLRRFLDDVIIPTGSHKKVSAEVKFFVEDMGEMLAYPCEMQLYTEVSDSLEVCPGIQYNFHSLYGLFLHECFQILERRTVVKSCRHCGKYFLPGSSKALYCSDRCKSAHNLISSSPEYKLYRKAYQRLHKRIHNPYHTATTKELSAFKNWSEEAKAALEKRTADEISDGEFRAIIERRIFG